MSSHKKKRIKAVVNCFADLGKEVFADVRPPRYNRHSMCWTVGHHDGSGMVEHTFDTEQEATAFFNDHKTTTK